MKIITALGIIAVAMFGIGTNTIANEEAERIMFRFEQSTAKTEKQGSGMREL